MTQRTRRIDRILAEAPLAASLLARARTGREVAAILAPVCAQLAPGFDPMQHGSCELRGQILRITLQSSAQSARIRQALPRLLAELRRRGWEVNEIKVAVQPGRARSVASGAPARGRAEGSAGLQWSAEYEQKLIAQLAFSRKLALALNDSATGRAAMRFAQAIDARLALIRESKKALNENDPEEDRGNADSSEQ